MSVSNRKNRTKKWSTLYKPGDPKAEAAIGEISREVGVSEILARLLYQRGYKTPAEATRFFRMEETALHDPFAMRDMDKAVARLETALAVGERIAIYGDYDVDGVTSVSLLYLYLRELGADVGYYIPSRSEEGYGLSNAAIDRLHERGVKLIVTVDTGITANSETAYAKTLGIDMVITDHHECRPELPQACAVVDPHRPDDSYPFRGLAGVGVVFKFVCAYEMTRCRRLGSPELEGLKRVCRTYMDLVAIGTVADVMPIADENRLIVAIGLRRMETDCRPGLAALMAAAAAGKSRPQKHLNSTYIGFTVAPRINAAGRVSRASIAVELLLSETEEQARAQAERLCELNSERQAEENRIAEAAYQKLEALPEEERRSVLVLDDDDWHQGIIGIVSSRMTERYGLPSILITYDGSVGAAPSPSDVGKGSGRSVQGMNLVEALTSCSELLLRYGGHELAAGLSIRRGDVEAFRRRINAYAAERFSEEELSFKLEIDCELSVEDLTISLAEELDRLEPFGVSNPVPSFLLRDMLLTRVQPMGGGKHLRLTVERDGVSVNCVWFGRGIAELPFECGERVDLVFQMNVNEFQGNRSLQLILQDAARSERDEAIYLGQVARYEAIKGGEMYLLEEEILPSREDVAVVYTYLRREFRAGRTGFPIRRLLRVLHTPQGTAYNYSKLKFIIRVLQELQICGVSEPTPDFYRFDISYSTKTNLEKSSILRRLRGQLKK